MEQEIVKEIHLASPVSAVWEALTVPGLMKEWMAEPEMQMEVATDWRVGGPIVIRGFHHVQFENKGTVLQFEHRRAVAYTYLSSISRLPDKPENYTHIGFRLKAATEGTALTLTLSNFPTESIRKHVDFYWSGTLGILKMMTEGREK